MAHSDRRARAQQIDRIYPDGHPEWERIAKPVLELLQRGPMGWEELDAFVAVRQMSGALFGNCLAWLENRGLVESFYASEDKVLWVATSVRWRDVSPSVEKHEVAEDASESRRRDGGKPQGVGDEVDGDPESSEEPENREDGDQYATRRHRFAATKRAATR